VFYIAKGTHIDAGGRSASATETGEERGEKNE
jgi:hypothetical protein